MQNIDTVRLEKLTAMGDSLAEKELSRRKRRAPIFIEDIDVISREFSGGIMDHFLDAYQKNHFELATEIASDLIKNGINAGETLFRAVSLKQFYSLMNLGKYCEAAKLAKLMEHVGILEAKEIEIIAQIKNYEQKMECNLFEAAAMVAVNLLDLGFDSALNLLRRAKTAEFHRLLARREYDHATTVASLMMDFDMDGAIDLFRTASLLQYGMVMYEQDFATAIKVAQNMIKHGLYESRELLRKARLGQKKQILNLINGPR